MPTLSDPVLFYLEHKQNIDQWCRLRAKATEEIGRFLVGLAPDLADQRPQGADFKRVDMRWMKFFYCRPEWMDQSGQGHMAIRVAIGLEWDAKNVQFSPNSVAPYTGIWLNRDHRGMTPLEDQLRQRLAESGYLQSNWWPAHRYCTSDVTWKQLDDARQQILKAVKADWDALADVVSAAVAAAGPA